MPPVGVLAAGAQDSLDNHCTSLKSSYPRFFAGSWAQRLCPNRHGREDNGLCTNSREECHTGLSWKTEVSTLVHCRNRLVNRFHTIILTA